MPLSLELKDLTVTGRTPDAHYARRRHVTVTAAAADGVVAAASLNVTPAPKPAAA